MGNCNEQTKQIQNKQTQQITALETKCAVFADRLSTMTFESKLRSHSFLAWKANVPKRKSMRKQIEKIEQLESALDAKNEIIQKQAKQIQKLETQLELQQFDANLTRSSDSFQNILHQTAGHHDAMREYLRESMAQITNTRQFDRTLTRDSTLKRLFESGTIGLTLDQTIKE